MPTTTFSTTLWTPPATTPFQEAEPVPDAEPRRKSSVQSTAQSTTEAPLATATLSPLPDPTATLHDDASGLRSSVTARRPLLTPAGARVASDHLGDTEGASVQPPGWFRKGNIDWKTTQDVSPTDRKGLPWMGSKTNKRPFGELHPAYVPSATGLQPNPLFPNDASVPSQRVAVGDSIDPIVSMYPLSGSPGPLKVRHKSLWDKMRKPGSLSIPDPFTVPADDPRDVIPAVVPQGGSSGFQWRFGSEEFSSGSVANQQAGPERILSSQAGASSLSASGAKQPLQWPGNGCQGFLCVDFLPSAVPMGSDFDLVIHTPFHPHDTNAQRVMIVHEKDPCLPKFGERVLPSLHLVGPTSATEQASSWDNVQLTMAGRYSICYCIVPGGCSDDKVSVFGSAAFEKVARPLIVREY